VRNGLTFGQRPSTSFELEFDLACDSMHPDSCRTATMMIIAIDEKSESFEEEGAGGIQDRQVPDTRLVDLSLDWPAPPKRLRIRR